MLFEKPIRWSAAPLMRCAAPALIAIATAGAGAPPVTYAHMAPLESYLMDRGQEIALARSAAPSSISKDATVLVLTRTGYETAVTGSNGFLCWVGRGFSGASDAPERWNPKIRAAECLNPAGARSVAPIVKLRTAMVLAGRSDAETLERIRSALHAGQIPPLEAGAMSYMMSKSSYLEDQGEHDMAHVMFFVPARDWEWGANAANSPFVGGNYWYFTPGHESEIAKMPPMSVFITAVENWSDGTPARAHDM